MTSSAGPSGARTQSAYADLAAENRRLRAEAAHRHLLDLATGVLSAQLHLPLPDATEHLDSLARATGLSVADIAADIVNAVAGDAPAVTVPSPEAAPVPAPARSEEARRERRAAAAAETADTVGEAARALLEGGLAPLGADSLWLWRSAGSRSLRLAGQAGVGASEAAAWQWLPPAVSEPFRSVLAEGTPAWLDEGPPGGEPLPGPSPDAARALVPLRRHGTTLGLALVGWPGTAVLDAPVRRAITGLLEVAATVLDGADSPQSATPVLADVLDALVHPAMLLRTHGRSGTPTVEHLNEAAVAALDGAEFPDLGSLTLAFPLVHKDLARLVRLAERSARTQRAARLPAAAQPGEGVPLIDVRVLPCGEERSVVLWHTAGDPRLATDRAVAQLQGVATFQDSLTGGGTVWSEQAYALFGVGRDEPPVPLLGMRGRLHRGDGEALTELLRTLTERQTGAHAVLRIVVPGGAVRHLRVAAQPLLEGTAVTGFAGVYQDVSDSLRTEAALTATFDHLTEVRNQAEMRRQLALQLQQAIVPEVPGVQELTGGLEVAARYRPAAEEYQVGGDWYDVLPLPSGKILVAVGDIAGHGIDSVTGMVALRNAGRALAFTGHPPRRLMGWLNEVTLRTGNGTTATAVCALYDPEDRALHWSSAGHLPLLLIRDGRAQLLDPPQDILLGALPSFAYQERRTMLRRGDTLLLYTDGLVERRHDGLGSGLLELAAAAEGLADQPVDRLVDGLLGAAAGDTDDDTSIVVVRLGDEAPDEES
ncbi:SpoIIE family protein phosphatase [Streptomyces sp. NPDC048629]|uniref:SpoIIE family protein phosphatase n=1 Tax=Streptomyces sp. NPDC048629 TaxID=3154824 RepID=UPI0034319D14